MVMPRGKHPKGASDQQIEASKKINQKYQELNCHILHNKYKQVRLMFQDEAGFGRISNPKRCWAPKGVRPVTPRHHIREYRYAYGCVEPKTGDSFYLVLPYANTLCMNIFLDVLSKEFPDDMLLVVLDRASWHTTKKLLIPVNVELFFLPAATPELNPKEQVWKVLRTGQTHEKKH